MSATDWVPTVGDCERAQTAWFHANASVDGDVWDDRGLRWAHTSGSGSVSLLFPRTLDPEALHRGLARAATAGLSIGAWLSCDPGADVDTAVLADAGFERGWDPWWMVADLAEVGVPDDQRVALETRTPEYSSGSEHATQLALAREHPATTWHATAREDGRLCGHAWAHRDGSWVGVFDMAVWRSARTGLGTALLQTVCAAARAKGGHWAALNATPEGARLYARHGFRRIGTGATWWWHPPR